jgi:MraZ protein
MATFIGDYPCKFDTKGRVSIPSVFRKTIQSDIQGIFVVRKNIFENCLDVYPLVEWKNQLNYIKSRTNPFNRRHTAFMRELHRDTVESTMDANGRILITRRLLNSVGIEKEAVMIGLDYKMELWAKEEYQQCSIEDNEFMDLAEEILGKGE